LDASGHTFPGYTGTVHFTTSDKGAGAVLPPDYTFKAGDGGVHTFTNGVTLVTAGNQTVTATDTVTGSITGQASVTVNAAAASTLVLSAPASVTKGSPFTVIVKAKDPYGNTAAGYRGTVHFTTSDIGTGVVLPANYTFTAGDGGAHTFTNGVALVTVGTQTVTATDTMTGSITGQASVKVTQAQAGNLIVNPGFETGNFSGWSAAAAPDGSYFGVGGNPHSGSRAAFFGAYYFERDDIYQNVPTVPGHTYRISYWVANQGGGNTEIRSSWGGTVLEDLFPANAFAYQQHTFTEAATSTSTQFRIGGYQVPALWFLDDVSVTDITTTSTFRVAMGTPIANSNNIADAVFAAAVLGPMTAGGVGVGSVGGAEGGTAPSIGKLTGLAVAAVDRTFASLHQGNAAFPLPAAAGYAHTEADSWGLSPFRGDEPLFI
jgi:hypothetical protein